MKPVAHIVIVDAHGRVDAGLQGTDGLTTLRVSGIDGVLEAIRVNPLVGVLVTEDSLGDDDAAALLGTVKRLQPDLPVIWIGRQPEAGAAPDATLAASATGDEVRACVDRLLRGELYPEPVIDLVKQGAEEVLARAFHTDVHAGNAVLRANRYTLGPVTAIVAFRGATIAGRVVLSSTPAYLGSLYRRVVPGDRAASSEEAEDLAGETANQVAGRLKAWFGSQGHTFDIAPPLYLCGDLAPVRYGAGRPSLVIPFEDSSGRLYLQLCLDLFLPRVDEPAGDAVEWGMMELL